MEIKKMPKNAKIFECKKCRFICTKKSNYDAHLLTSKHKMEIDGNKMEIEKMPLHTCSCGKSYKTNSGLWKHRKTCKKNAKKCLIENDLQSGSDINAIQDDKYNSHIIDKDLIMVLIKENSDLKEMMMENQTKMMEQHHKMLDVIKNSTPSINYTQNNNKTFNLQLFLNETCKNAMNIMDFVESLKLQLSDLENMGEIGYINGMSNIILKNLKDMDVSERPVHCTDTKREILYIKHDNKWEKEDSDKPKFRKAIKHISHKNAKLIAEFKEKYPDCTHSDSKYSDQYNKLVIEAMGGINCDNDNNENKIIKRVTKEIVVNKEN